MISTDPVFTPDEMMTVVASRYVKDNVNVFVGIGLPSVACNLARALHAPRVKLIYESGTIGAKPTVLPLSIGDEELADTADAIVSVPDIFRYWLQAGRVDLGFLGGAQVDKYGNINTTVIGDYSNPKVRLPGAGGAPEIASSAHRFLIMLKQNLKTFVNHLDFVTSPGKGAEAIITDLGVLTRCADSNEFELSFIYPGVEVGDVKKATGWELKISSNLKVMDPPTAIELNTLREIKSRVKAEPDTTHV